MELKKIKKMSLLLISAMALVACNSETEVDDTSSSEPVEQSETTQEAAETEVAVNKEGFPIVDQQITLDILAPGVGQAEWEDMPVMQNYTELTNIAFNYTTPPQSDFATRLNLAFASGELPDLIYAGGPNSLNAAGEVDYGSQGLLIPLENMLEEYAPNFYQLLEENPAIRQSITTTDGHIYALPNVVQSDTASWIMGPVWYNGEWLDNLDVEAIPETVDEFYELMIRFRDEDPNDNGQQDEIPISDVSMNGLRGWFMPAFGIKGWGIEEHDGQARYTFATDNFRAYLEYMNKLYQEGLLDRETFSQSGEQKQAKGQNNQIGVFQDWFSYFTTGQSEEEALNNPMFGPLTSEWQQEPVMPMDPGIKRGSFAITKENPYPEATLRWVDYFYSPEGYEYISYGPEGYLWEWDEGGEEAGNKVYNEEVDEENREQYRGTLTPAYGITIPALTVELDPIGGSRSEFTDFIKEETDEKIVQHGEHIFPLVYLTAQEQEEVNTIKVDLETYIVESEAAFITGNREINDGTWAEYIETLEKIGVRRIEEIHQAAYDRWVEAGE
ncbi:extracellular solute-binding protein [Ruoffia halotolerans]|uniref:extracellular solute-binding protein n=1 Tax=Ruoffia halotolerans TaxID=2748684 RepID=UPI001C54DC5B|nr:extracellular solute-binding protein [Ruoffia halotolerans]